MNESTQALRRAIATLFELDDATAIADCLARFAGIGELCGHSYPYLHRILDVKIGGSGYRVYRCAACGERLFVKEVDTPVYHLDGVPLWLTGEKLSLWIADENNHPSEDQIDWEKYR